MLRDARDRLVDYLRVSVTDRCNLRCRYCMPAEGVPLVGHADVLRYEEIAAFVAVAASQGVGSVRLTGGEPLVRPGCPDLVRLLRAIPGVRDLSLTTNATLLARQAGALKEAGLDRVNIGLPSLVPDTYRELTRGGELADALAGLDAAVALGFAPVKLNVVALKGLNDDPLPWLELTRRLPVEVRFIEYMPIGAEDHASFYLPAATLLARLEAAVVLEEVDAMLGFGPATRALQIPGAPGRLAVIAPVSEHFCGSCNRLRLTAEGRLRLCLLAAAEVDLKPALRPEAQPDRLRALLRRAIATKPERSEPGLADFGRRMSQIGG
jgi:cyclic pyranopterin phosphate synthase